MRIITYCDNNYFGRVIGLIGSALSSNYDNIESIDVYDLGIIQINKNWLSAIDKVRIREVVPTSPCTLKPYRKHSEVGSSDMVTGLYSFKPVVIKQALDLYEQVLVLDAGITIKGDLRGIWDWTTEHNYWFLKLHDINWCMTQYVKRTLNVTEYEWQQDCITAGSQCLNRNVYDSYVMPVYEMTKDIELFRDDGSASGGVNCGRHDQTLFSIQAVRAGLKPLPSSNPPHWTTTENKTVNATLYYSRGDSNTEMWYKYINKHHLRK